MMSVISGHVMISKPISLDIIISKTCNYKYRDLPATIELQIVSKINTSPIYPIAIFACNHFVTDFI